ncbi:cellulase family glycosylhydrolase [Flammeovirga kamogawensis]|uniref:Cellulase family glycosylhydrolase n=1 Tax=Flammeovirga kamogawensis TaxID=373891 RepID=A0ABX8GUK9_9BACT|nr:cellulase family glycosylhydrolase [Flammeovirga kamogawensis]MBB6459653.1 aryl-phospho-beta-D-glucosidase BglC (GH1 family) [Flammeovirga kamogawensis]QWG07284.1 cellulase family glycosylhydrolase [Flammeovirga kamogawensis]TRX69103.1 cellulase family glycosylhydrolase [Flammeovirga kamogawensis]
MYKSITILFLSFLLSHGVMAQLTPYEAVEAIGRGINLGNTLDAPKAEGDWAPKAEEYYFDAYKEAGFQSVRIPITWDNRVSKTEPYEVDADFMNRVEEVVDWGLERNLVIIINVHHDDWLKEDYNKENIARFEAIWTQISERFHTKSDSLLFEPLNEPQGMTIAEAADANKRALAIIREKNPTRNVIISGNGWSAIKDLLTMPVPTGDNHLIGYFHTYDPWDFSSAEKSQTWGTKSDKEYISNEFKKAKDWSTQNRIPVIISEFGAVHKTDFNSRMRHYAHFVEESLSRGISFMAWDDGGWYEIYQRKAKKWHETKDILIYNTTETATNLELSIQNDSTVLVEWENRNDATSMLKIERKINEEFVVLDSVNSTVTSYLDETTVQGNKYQYRISQIVGEKLIISYPQKINVLNTVRDFYAGVPIAIPGTLEAENYDIGGEGFTFSDSEELNQGGAYRTDGVDIEEITGGYQVGYVEKGEWLEYSVDVKEAATYKITAFIAAMEGGGEMTIKSDLNSREEAEFSILSTNSWTEQTSITSNLKLEAGEQILRLTINAKPAFNIDKLTLEVTEEVQPPLALEDEITNLLVYPNPSSGKFNISKGDKMNTIFDLQVLNAIGNNIASFSLSANQTSIDLSKYPKGIYFIKYFYNQEVKYKKIVKE